MPYLRYYFCIHLLKLRRFSVRSAAGFELACLTIADPESAILPLGLRVLGKTLIVCYEMFRQTYQCINSNVLGQRSIHTAGLRNDFSFVVVYFVKSSSKQILKIAIHTLTFVKYTLCFSCYSLLRRINDSKKLTLYTEAN